MLHTIIYNSSIVLTKVLPVPAQAWTIQSLEQMTDVGIVCDGEHFDVHMSLHFTIHTTE